MTDKNLAQEAIQQALSGNWQQALILNKKILEENKEDIDALNRTARAYAELGKLEDAKKTAQLVLKIDMFNNIALKALAKWKTIKKADVYKSEPIRPQLFLEEPGKTKMLSLINVGDKSVVAKLDAGDEVKLNTHGHKISVNTKDGKYLGRIPDDLSARIKTLLANGYEYGVWIKSADTNEVKVFIRELKRAHGYSDVPSFNSEKIDYISFTPPELIHKKEEAAESSENDEEQSPSEE